MEPSTPSCSDAAHYAASIFNTDLSEITTWTGDKILEIFEKVRANKDYFENNCYRFFSKSYYDHSVSVFHGALLKLCVALEEKGASDKDITSLYSEDEKKALRELEKFSRLDPDVTPPELLCELIVSESGEIYKLIKEAVDKQYIDFKNLISSWGAKGKIRAAVVRAFTWRYEARFRNVVEAVKRLLDQQPAWLKKIFKEYEEALLSSYAIRSEFEKKCRSAFEEISSEFFEKARLLEASGKSLIQAANELARELYTRLDISGERKEELLGLVAKWREDYGRLRTEYESFIKSLDDRIREVEGLKARVADKEKELSEAAMNEKEATTSREVLEAEALRLRNVLADYERKLGDYLLMKENLGYELEMLRDQIDSLEEAVKTGFTGHLITAEEASVLEEIFIRKFVNKMHELPKRLPTPWGDEVVSKWDKEYLAFERDGGERPTPKNLSAIFKALKRSMFGLGEERVIEVRGTCLSHIEVMEKHGFDREPLRLADFIKLVRSVGDPSRHGKKLTVLGVASTTSFDVKVLEYIASGKAAKSFLFKDLLVILVDLVSGEVHYNKAVPYAEYYAKLLSPEISYEEEAKVERALRTLYEEAYARNPIAPSIPYEGLAKRSGADALTILRVLNRMVREGNIEVKGLGSERMIMFKAAPG